MGNGSLIGDVLTNSTKINGLSFTGSTEVGLIIQKNAAKNLMPTQLELGGKNPAVVLKDADLDEASSAIVLGAFACSGQWCTSTSRVIVEKEVAKDLVEMLKSKTQKIKIGNGSHPETGMGPVCGIKQLETISNYITIGKKEGATLCCGGDQLTEGDYKKGCFVKPTIFSEVTEKMRIATEEIFGPVLCVVRQPDLASAIDLINAHPYANGTAIFTCDGAAAREFSSKIQVGMVGINVPIPVPIAYHSFGGWKQSIFGDISMHGDEGIRFYTKTKSVTTRWPQNEKLAAVYHMPVN